MEKDDFWYVQRSDGALLKVDHNYPIQAAYYRLWRKSKQSATTFNSHEEAIFACSECVKGMKKFNRDVSETPDHKHNFYFLPVRNSDLRF